MVILYVYLFYYGNNVNNSVFAAMFESVVCREFFSKRGNNKTYVK